MAEKSKPTPGPWYVSDPKYWKDGNYLMAITVGPPLCTVADVWGAKDPIYDGFAGASEAVGNARLIAAAPALCAALERALSSITGDEDWIEEASAALAQVRGE